LDNGDDALEFFGGKFTGATGMLGWHKAILKGYLSSIPLVQVDIGFLADQVGVPTTHTLDLRQGVHDLLLACPDC
jgi:hypothetical protein